jgi:hypothetical protein
VALISLCSITGAPGVTTTAVAMALSWARPVIVLEADTSTPSSVIPGFLRAGVDNSRGVLNLAVQAQAGPLAPAHLWAQLIPLHQDLQHLPADHDRYLLPGIAHPQAGSGLRAVWREIARVLGALPAMGVDVIADLGRVHPEDPRWELLEASQTVAVLTRTSLPAIAALAATVPALAQRLEQTGRRELLTLITAEEARPGYSDREIAKHLGVPVTARLPWDPAAAAVFSAGATATSRWRRAPLHAGVRTAAEALEAAATARLARLTPASVQGPAQEARG